MFQNFEKRRGRERAASGKVKIPRRRKDIDQIRSPGAKNAGELLASLVILVKNETNARSLADRVANKPGIEYLNPNVLAVTLVFLARHRFEISKLTPSMYNAESLDELLSLVIKGDYDNLSDFKKAGLYATVIRYVEWYNISIKGPDTDEPDEPDSSDVESLISETEDEESSEQEDLNEIEAFED